MDELNTLYRMSQGKQGVAEGLLGEADASAVQFRTASTDNYQSSFTVTAIADGKNVGHFSFFRDPETDDVHNQAEVTDDVRGKGYGKALLLKAIEVANDHGLGFQEDSQSLSRAQSRVYDSLYDAGWIVDADGYWFLTPEGEQELARLSTIQQGVAEGREKFNDEVMRPGFRWSEDINGITYLVRTRWDNMPEVVARVNNREVGRATFINHRTRSGLESVSTYVSPKWQGWGIAKNMYAVMRMLGANIQPSATQTAMGKDMWAKWKKGGDTKHLTSMNAKIDEQGVTEFAPAANDDNDKKSYLLQLAQALGDAMYGPNKNKQAVLDIKSKITDAGGDVKILWNDDGTFNVVMYHPTYFKQGYLIKLVGGQAPGSLSENNKVESKLSVDVPNEEWLQDKIDYAKRKGRNSYGVPYMGSTTASVRGAPPRVRVMRLASLPGMRNEQTNVRRDDLKWLMDYMERTGRLPPANNPNEEYLPYIMVAYNGEAWVNEGNHRIMAAYRLNWQDMPIEIRYFDGGERIESGPMAPGKIGLA